MRAFQFRARACKETEEDQSEPEVFEKLPEAFLKNFTWRGAREDRAIFEAPEVEDEDSDETEDLEGEDAKVLHARDEAPLETRSDAKKRKKKVVKKTPPAPRGRQVPAAKSKRPQSRKEEDDELFVSDRAGAFGKYSLQKWVVLVLFLLGVAYLAFVPEEPVKRRKKTVSKGELHCTQEMADHVHVLKRWEYPEPATGVVPRISLHAPCLWTSFAKASTKWAPSGQWYWKRTRVGELERVEIQHPNERPLSVLNITSSCNNCYNQMHRALSQNMFPLFGELTDLTYQWYQMQYGSGLVIMLPDPEAHSGLLKAQEYWRGTFEGLAHEFSPKYRMAYASTFDEDSRRWIRKEFGVTEFPAVVIQKADKPGERQDSRGHVFQGDITYQDLALQIQDANAGCFSWPHPMLTFGGMKDVREHPKCMEPTTDTRPFMS
ncbi:Methyltranfer_dom domain-containing protein [Durusdinium trenchii]|uniref:Methyltranfer_dom domain-containing protein n=1 Tax=Durusdinium trenchii TaxID=1381693 RepID=A0ABP0LXB4_9DINO